MKKPSANFRLGFGCTLTFYILGCILVPIIGLSIGTMSLAVVIGFCFYAVFTTLYSLSVRSSNSANGATR